MDKEKSKKIRYEKQRESFRKLGLSRVDKVLTSLRVLGNLSNTSNYKYTADEVEKIFSAIKSQLDTTQKKFEAGLKSQDKNKFSW